MQLSIPEKIAIKKKFYEKCVFQIITAFAKSVNIGESTMRKIVNDREKLYNAVINDDCKRRREVSRWKTQKRQDTNADGSEKLPLLVLEKSAKPRFFKNVK